MSPGVVPVPSKSIIVRLLLSSAMSEGYFSAVALLLFQVVVLSALLLIKLQQTLRGTRPLRVVEYLPDKVDEEDKSLFPRNSGLASGSYLNKNN